MPVKDREQRLVFGEIAELYDRYRPGYPEAVFDRISEYGGLAPGDRALEVGAGTGRATLPLAARSLRVVALEPSPGMAKLLRRRTRQLERVEVVEALFEEWPLPDLKFQLVASAQAWHWVDPEVRLGRAHQVLAPGATLALLWNTEVPSGDSARVRAELDDVYRRLAPTLSAGGPSELEVDRRLEIEASGLYREVAMEAFPWSARCTTAEWLGLLQTQSDHRLLEPRAREQLLGAVAGVLDGAGGAVTWQCSTRLYLARAKP